MKRAYPKQRALSGFAVLDLFSNNRREIRVADVAQVFRIHASTASRLLSAMQHAGVLERDERRGAYRPGIKLVEYARLVLDANDTRRVCRPHLERLAAEVGETANLGSLDRGYAFTLDEVQGPEFLRYTSWIGRRAPWYCTSIGKAIMAFQPDEVQRAGLRGPFERCSPATLIEPRVLARQLKEVRARGYATACDELEDGVTAVAAPLKEGKAASWAICIVGPSFRLARKIDGLGAAVVLTADRTSQALQARDVSGALA